MAGSGSRVPAERVDLNLAFFDRAYVALVSLETRGTPAAAQLNFLERFVLAHRRDISILDLCCGHGRHLAGLARAGRNLAGIDSNEYFLEIARAELGSDIQLRLDDVTACELGAGFDFILCLENSFIFEDADAHRVMRKMRSALVEGGVAVIHLSNPAYVSKHLPSRTWRGVEDEWFILEERDHDQGRCRIRHKRFRKSAGDNYEMHPVELTIYLRSLHELSALAGRSGFRLRETFGSFSGDPYGEDSPDIICLFELSGASA